VVIPSQGQERDSGPVTSSGRRPPSVLQVIVGYGLPVYFVNAVRSVRAAAPDDDLLVIDNASPGTRLRQELSRIADADDKISLVLRTVNDVRGNRKVGSLYSAYEIAFEQAMAGGFDYLHIIQGDFQLLWWDSDVVSRAAEIFDSRPGCVNIQTQLFSRDKVLAEELVPAGVDGLLKLRRYGLSDTGLYHLGRWRASSMRFGQTEQGHARRYLAEGLEVICHPWPTAAPIPWPTVMRNGKQRGSEVRTTKPYLLQPLGAGDVALLKHCSGYPWLEDFCVPWGWVCASPMWVTGLDSIDYWVLRYRDARKNGLRHLFPHPDLRGVDDSDRHGPLRTYRYRPPAFRLLVGAPMGEVARKLRSLGSSQCG
jgi:hypothetical protein